MSRLYLVPAVVVIGLGVTLIARRVLHPPAIAEGCIEVELRAPDSLRAGPVGHLSLQVCPHFDETTLYLQLLADSGLPGTDGSIFSGTGPAGPRHWPQALRFRWLSADTVQVAYSGEVTFLYRRTSAGRLNVVYLPLATRGT
jgi:hypothetical protein